MSETKYYTPTIEEFYVGFECEIKDDESDFDGTIILSAYDTEYLDRLIKNKSVRVKYLDRDDIEEAGWRLFGSPLKLVGGEYENDFPIVYQILGEKQFMKNSPVLASLVQIRENIYNIYKTTNGDEAAMEFKGIIKNKSELKKIMKQLNIK